MRLRSLLCCFSFAAIAVSCTDTATAPHALKTTGLAADVGSPTSLIQPQVSGGEQHTCTLDVLGAVRCWGTPPVAVTVPTALPAATRLSSGLDFNCVLTSDGSVQCWGANGQGQLRIPADLGAVTEISSAGYHTCALKADATVACWGANGSGELRIPASLTSVVSLGAGTFHTCAVVVGGKVVCWGSNFAGETVVPTNLGAATQVTGGEGHSCALLTDGTVTCWGYNGDGETRVPTGLTGVIEIRSGDLHTCALKQDGTVVCWGYNGDGETRVPTGLNSVVHLGTGWFHTCAIKRDGSVVCWGQNQRGQSTPPAGLNLIPDNTPPNISYTISPAANSAGWNRGAVSVTWTVQDPESGVSQSTGCDALTLSSEGVSSQTCAATNGVGLSNSATATVRIDQTAPTLVVPVSLNADATSPSGANVTYAVNATDALSGVASIDCSIASGSLFAIGTTTVTCTASDIAGNTSESTFDVTVLSAQDQAKNLIETLTNDPTLSGDQPLINQLEKALAKPDSACKDIDKFIETVQKDAGKKIPVDRAAELINAATTMKGAMGCP